MGGERQSLKDCVGGTMDDVRDVILSRLTLTLWLTITGGISKSEILVSRLHVLTAVYDDSEAVSESEPVEREDVGWSVDVPVATFSRHHAFAQQVSNDVGCRVASRVTFGWFKTPVRNEVRSCCE